MLAGVEKLAKVSATPGHTQLINFFSMNNKWTLVDLPGYGYAKTQRGARDLFAKMITGYIAGRKNLAGVFVLIDSRHEPQKIDVEFVSWLLENAVPFALVFSKVDKVKPALLQTHIDLFLAELADKCEEEPPVFKTSVQDRVGRRELLAFIGETLTELAGEK